jgi:hypothetical protein
VVECQLPKLDVAGSSPVARSPEVRQPGGPTLPVVSDLSSTFTPKQDRTPDIPPRKRDSGRGTVRFSGNSLSSALIRRAAEKKKAGIPRPFSWLPSRCFQINFTLARAFSFSASSARILGQRVAISLQKQRNYGIRALNSSGLIAMNNAIISPTANPTIVPAATPRQSAFCSLVVISTSQRHGNPTTS